MGIHEGRTLIPSTLKMPYRAKIDWDPEVYAYVDRCRAAAIKQAVPIRKWAMFLRQTFCTQGMREMSLLGDTYFGVKSEGQE